MVNEQLEYVKCNLCGADDSKLWGEYEEIRLVQCKSCGLIYKNPRTNEKDEEDLYDKKYWFNLRREHRKQQQARKKMYEIEFEKLEKYSKGGRIFDVGCGYGDFLAALGKEWDKYGCDVSSFGIDYAKREHNLTNVYCGDIFENDFPDNYFDVIYMRGVIHHTSDPLSNLKKANDLLKGNGLLVISMSPNLGGIGAKVFKDRFLLIDPPRHSYFFSEDTLKRMLVKVGFSPDEVWYPYFGTGYESWKDLPNFIKNAFLVRLYFPLLDKENLKNPKYAFVNKDVVQSPPFYGNMMCIYSKNTRVIEKAGGELNEDK